MSCNYQIWIHNISIGMPRGLLQSIDKIQFSQVIKTRKIRIKRFLSFFFLFLIHYTVVLIYFINKFFFVFILRLNTFFYSRNMNYLYMEFELMLKDFHQYCNSIGPIPENRARVRYYLHLTLSNDIILLTYFFSF